MYPDAVAVDCSLANGKEKVISYSFIHRFYLNGKVGITLQYRNLSSTDIRINKHNFA